MRDRVFQGGSREWIDHSFNSAYRNYSVPFQNRNHSQNGWDHWIEWLDTNVNIQGIIQPIGHSTRIWDLNISLGSALISLRYWKLSLIYELLLFWWHLSNLYCLRDRWRSEKKKEKKKNVSSPLHGHKKSREEMPPKWFIWLPMNMRIVFEKSSNFERFFCWEDSRALLTRAELLCSLADANSAATLAQWYKW